MKKYDEESLISEGYKIQNARITGADLSMADHGCLTFSMPIQVNGWACAYGGYCLGHGYLGAEEFDGSGNGLEYLMRIMDTVGVERLQDLQGKYIRVATKGWGDVVKIIGNVIKDKWFDPESFFKDKEC